MKKIAFEFSDGIPFEDAVTVLAGKRVADVLRDWRAHKKRESSRTPNV